MSCLLQSFVAVASAQNENFGKTSVNAGFSYSIVGYDSTLSVRCTYNEIRFYVESYCHIPPSANFSRGDLGKYHHKCVGNDENEQAQTVFLARLDKLIDIEVRHRQLPIEVRKMVYNFELITGISNSYGDGDFLGPLYISIDALDGWKKWFNENKDKLGYCPQFHVLYIAHQE